MLSHSQTLIILGSISCELSEALKSVLGFPTPFFGLDPGTHPLSEIEEVCKPRISTLDRNMLPEYSRLVLLLAASPLPRISVCNIVAAE